MQEIKPWFESWFDTKYYHILYQHRDNAEAHFFIDNIVKYLQVNFGEKVLDLACGKGRHSIYLNSKKLNVTGLDLSAQSIAYAKQFENESLHFNVHDMRKIYPQKFDFIFNLFTSFGYFDDENENQKAIDAMAAMMKPNSKLVIDFLNSTKTINNLVKKEEKTLDGIVFKIQRELINGFIVKKIIFEDNGNTYTFQERVKALGLTDFKRYFEQAGLNLNTIFGSFDLKEYDQQNSDRLIMVLTKR